MMAERDINAAALRGVDVLATRSKTRINDALLEGSTLQFYGTATAGTDHVDAGALARRGIAWSAAPGSNANSVAEYVIAALAWFTHERGLAWSGKTIAIIGAGNVGARLAALAPALGLRVRLNDPPRRDATGDPALEPLEDVVAGADIVTLHAPLTDDGPYPTRGMAGAPFFERMKPGALFINAARGEVVDEPALLAAARAGQFAGVVLDVFDHEPAISSAMCGLATIATPHIAGYSLDGRRLGTEMIYRAACRHFGREPAWRIEPEAHPRAVAGDSAMTAILSAYNPALDDQRLRAVPPGVAMADHFNRMRKEYPERREFRCFRPTDVSRISEMDRAALGQLGFAGICI